MATVVLALANGVGVVAYLVAWLVLPAEGDGTAAEPAASRPAGGGRARLAVGVGCVTLGTLLLVRWAAPFFPDGLVWPAAIAGLGIGVALARAGDGDHRWRDLAARLPGNPVEVLRGGGVAWVRIAAGTGLLVLGLGTFLATNGAFRGPGCHRHVGAGHGAGRGAHPGTVAVPAGPAAGRRAAGAHPQRGAG